MAAQVSSMIIHISLAVMQHYVVIMPPHSLPGLVQGKVVGSARTAAARQIDITVRIAESAADTSRTAVFCKGPVITALHAFVICFNIVIAVILSTAVVNTRPNPAFTAVPQLAQPFLQHPAAARCKPHCRRTGYCCWAPHSNL